MIQPHPTWSIHDSSKIQTYQECPRKYFFEYMLGWRPESPNNHLVFGEGWHRAREHTLLHGFTPDSITEAYDLFEKYYRSKFDEITDDLFHPKCPAAIIPALVAYSKHWAGDEFEVITTEVAGVVSLDDTLALHFRLDAILKDKSGLYWVMEHKTGSRGGDFWDRQWELKVQIGTYIHVLHMLYHPGAKIGGLMVDGTLFQKSGFQFRRVPIRKHPSQIMSWHSDVRWWVQQIEGEISYLLNEQTDKEDIMACFPRNGENCTKWMRTCEYHDFCSAQTWANPLQHCHEIPIGFRQEWWDPREREKLAKTRVSINEKGEITKE